jgi:hypothetical protein
MFYGMRRGFPLPPVGLDTEEQLGQMSFERSILAREAGARRLDIP